MLNWIREKDIFGVPVQLTYKGSSSYTTLVGGVSSIIFIVSFATYAIWTFHTSYFEPTF